MTRWLEDRPIGRRLLVNGTLTVLTAMRCGGTDSMSLSDQPILRNHMGIPYIPGTTLAGLFRSHLADSLAGEGPEPPEVACLLGCTWGKNDQEQSSLIIDDAPMIVTGVIKTELRDGVKIDPENGTAQKKMKYDMELLPRDSKFRLSFELLLKGDGKLDTSLLENFLWLMQQLENGEIMLGSRTRRGFGRCKVGEWTWMDFDMSSWQGQCQWLGLNGGIPVGWPKPVRHPLPAQNGDYALSDMAKELGIAIPIRPGKTRLAVHLKLAVAGSLLIRSGGHLAGEADAIHLHRINQNSRKTEPIVPGTSLAGILRNRAVRILNTVSKDSGKEGRVQKYIDGLFGTEKVTRQSTDATASRVWTRETLIRTNPVILRHTRTAIDRWRGSALETMLLEEDALFGGTVTLKWDVIQPTSVDIALCLCLIKDLFTGDLPLGGESSIGRGTLYGLEGKVTIPGNGAPIVIGLSGDGKGSMTVTGETDIYFQELTTQFAMEDVRHAA